MVAYGDTAFRGERLIACTSRHRTASCRFSSFRIPPGNSLEYQRVGCHRVMRSEIIDLPRKIRSGVVDNLRQKTHSWKPEGSAFSRVGLPDYDSRNISRSIGQIGVFDGSRYLHGDNPSYPSREIHHFEVFTPWTTLCRLILCVDRNHKHQRTGTVYQTPTSEF